MDGIIDKPADAQAAEPQAAQSQGGSPQMAEPDEQAQDQYNRFVAAGIKLLNASSEEVVQMLTQGPPASSLANAAFAIVSEVRGQSPAPMDILIQAGIEVIANIEDLAEAAGVLKHDEAVSHAAAQEMATMLLEEFGTGDDAEALAELVGSVDHETAERIGSEQQAYKDQANGSSTQ